MYIFGAGGHGKVIVEIAESRSLKIEGFIDTNNNNAEVLGYEIFKNSPSDACEMIIAIGNNEIRKRIAFENPKSEYPVIIHINSIVSKRAKLNFGTVVMAGTTINTNVSIGRHCIVNTNASIDHDCIIEDFVHLSPNVALAGNVIVGEGTHIGIGACVIQGIKIGRWCTIGAGAVIIKDVPDGCTVVGNPGRIIKKYR